MAYTNTGFFLTNLIQAAYRELGQLLVSTATGGDATSIVDTKEKDKHDDTAWDNGGFFIIKDADGAGASPEGKFGFITSWAESTGTFTIPTVTAAVVATDIYGVCNDYYPLAQMQELANDALRMLGDIPLIDITTLDTASSKTEYAYAVTWKRKPPIKVEIQTRTGDADDFQWREIHDWQYRPATAGTAGLLVLPQLIASRDIAVWYVDKHPAVSVYSDPIVETVAPELAVKALVLKALAWQNRRMMGGDDYLLQTLNDAKIEYEMAKIEYPIWKPKRSSKLLILGSYVDSDNLKVPNE